MSLGINLKREEIPTLMDTFRSTLLKQSLSSTAALIHSVAMGLEPSTDLALVQFYADVLFLNMSFDFDTKSDAELHKQKQLLEQTLSQAEKQMRRISGSSSIRNSLADRHKHVFELCGLLLSSLFGQDAGATSSAVGELDLGSSTSSPLFRAPLASSKRFPLLPVQADRTLNEIEMRGKYAKEKEAAASRPEASSGVMSSGLGFLSSMLKKN
jgi:hypothetical protein